METRGYAALHAKDSLVPFSFSRRDLRAHDVAFDVVYSGVCHSDIHQVDEDWGPSIFPMVPGHEIVGVVTASGARPRNSRWEAVLVWAPSWTRVGSATTAYEANSSTAWRATPRHTTGTNETARRLPSVATPRILSSTRTTRCTWRTRWTFRCRTTAVRGHHALLPASSLGRASGHRGRHHRTGRSRSHGGQVRHGTRGDDHRVFALGGQGVRRASPRRS